MTRREEFCGGRLVREIYQIQVGDPDDPQYADGPHMWLLDGETITRVEAEAFRIAWEEAQR